MNDSGSGETQSDDEIARLEQERLYSQEPSDIPMANLINTDADADLALKLQKEEYSKDSFLIRRQRNDPSITDDAAIAARLQAEEDVLHERQAARLQRREQRRSVFPVVMPMPLDDLAHRQDDFTPNDYEVNRRSLGAMEDYRLFV